MKVCIIGGGGYVGSQLVPYLVTKHELTVLDTFWYGDHLPFHNNIRKIKGDIRNRGDLRRAFEGQDAVIHLACISNDPSFDMSPGLGKAVNYTCFIDCLKVLQESHIKRFIYASSSSVYGVSDLKDVREDAPKNPLTDYSRFKLACEKDLKAFGSGGTWTILRPATVCGYSPRLRLDLVVNALTINALMNRRINLYGREQKRPNININDMVRAYDFILSAPTDQISGQVFNVGFENKSLIEIAHTVIKVIRGHVQINEEPTNDPRSYHVNSDKIKSIGFAPTETIEDAISSIRDVFHKHKLHRPLENANYYNIKKMKELINAGSI